jgi:hypothetical protein
MQVSNIIFQRREVKEVALRLNITYDVFSVTADNLTLAVYIELSDQPEQCIKDVVIDAIKRRFGSKVDNINETYKMFIKAWSNRRDNSIIQMH